jgi:SAM-dependent methyltransferase
MSLNFSARSYEKELLDGEGIPFGDIETNMRELDFINTWLGGHGISIMGLKRLLRGRDRVTICEIGCGGGDNLRVLSRYCRRHHVEVRVTGIDNNAHCITVAREKWEEGPAEWVCSDYRQVCFEKEKPDIIFSSLFCHHFTDDELVEQLRWMEANAEVGWFINDLHRHPLAYYSIRRLTGWWSGSYLVKHDAPLSVLRGFTRGEWQELLRKAGITHYSLQWKWAFRWLVSRATLISSILLE